jgi:ketosteroid isomerase-like protein
MSEESTTPDLEELARGVYEAGNRHDLDAVMSFWGPDPVLDMSSVGLGVYDGRATIRRFLEGWIDTYEDFEIDAEEVQDLGNGVTFVVVLQKGRPVGSNGHVQARYGSVGVWAQRLAVRITNYADLDEARAAAERLAEERR